MPKRKRDKMKRTMAQAHHGIDIALKRIHQLFVMFDGVHQNHAEVLTIIGRGLLHSQALMEGFWKASWGKWPDDLGPYRGLKGSQEDE